MTTAYQPADRPVPDLPAPSSMPSLRLWVGPIERFGEANGILRRVKKLPGVGSAALSGVREGGILIEAWAADLPTLESGIRLAWGDRPGTSLKSLSEAGSPPELQITLGRRPGA